MLHVLYQLYNSVYDRRKAAGKDLSTIDDRRIGAALSRCDNQDRPRKRGDPWITISTGRRRLRRDSNPVYRLLSASRFFETESALYDRVTAGASSDLFLFFLASLFFPSFFFSPASTGFVLPYRRNEQLSARIGPALAEY